jgi:predicted MFS family arabinose efflux permease
MIQRMKIDLILLIIGITFLSYSVLGEHTIDANLLRFIIGVEFILGALYLMLSPDRKYI